MKQWKDNDKLTGVDYTYERTLTTDKIQSIDEDAGFKDRDLFILEDEKPVQNVYINTIWMDSANALDKLSRPNLIYVLSSIVSKAALSYQRNFEDLQITSTTFCNASFNIPTIEIPEIQINSEVHITVVTQQSFSREAEESVSSSENISGIAQQNLSIDVVGIETNSEHNITAVAQQNLSISIEGVETFSTHNISAQLQQNASLDIEGVKTNSEVNITLVTQQNFSKTGAEFTTSDNNFSGIAQQNLSSSLPPVSITSTDSVTVVVQQNSSKSITGVQTNSSTFNRAISNTDDDITTFTSTLSDALFNAVTQQDFSKNAPANTITSSDKFTAITNQDFIKTGLGTITSSDKFTAITNQSFVRTGAEATQSNQLFEATPSVRGTDTVSESISSNKLFEGIATNIVNSLPVVTSISSNDLMKGTQFIIANEATGSETVTSDVVIDGGPLTYLLQARSFGASAPITRTFSDTGTSQVYLPTGVTVTLRENTPNNTEITLTAPLTVNDGGSTWNFEKWRYNSTGFEVPASVSNTTFETVNNDEIYEVYYTLPPTANWQIVPVQSFSTTFTVFSDNDTSNSTVIALVTAQYPPQNYSLNYVARVLVANYDMEIIATRYVKRF